MARMHKASSSSLPSHHSTLTYLLNRSPGGALNDMLHTQPSILQGQLTGPKWLPADLPLLQAYVGQTDSTTA